MAFSWTVDSDADHRVERAFAVRDREQRPTLHTPTCHGSQGKVQSWRF